MKDFELPFSQEKAHEDIKNVPAEQEISQRTPTPKSSDDTRRVREHQDQQQLRNIREELGIQAEKEGYGKSLENILEGRGIEEVAKVGWKKYREALEQISYADIIERQAKQIDKIKSAQDQGAQPIPEWVTQGQNIQASERAKKLSEWFTAEYSNEKSFSFSVFQDRGKKLIIQGREKMTDEKGDPIDGRVTRIYFTVPTRNSPEAFKALFTSLTDEGVMNRMQLALNLENYQAESLDKSFENNTIIAYVYGKDPQLMTRVVKAISRAKTESPPELWKLQPNDLAKAKEELVKDFMIPLDDTTGFVEAKNLNSYHAGPRGRMFHQITGNMPDEKMSLSELAQSFKTWTPERPSPLHEDPERRRFMPALVFNHKSSIKSVGV